MVAGYRTCMTETIDTTEEHPVRPLTDLLQRELQVAMVTTMVGREHTSRPVASAEIQDHRISFLVNRRAAWVEAVAAAAAIVHVTFADDAHSLYVSLNGTAHADSDNTEIVRLWTPAAQAWFDGPNDPDLAVVHFDVTDGEYWDGPNGVVGRVVATLRAALSGSGDDLGTQGRVAGNGTDAIDLDAIVPHRITSG